MTTTETTTKANESQKQKHKARDRGRGTCQLLSKTPPTPAGITTQYGTDTPQALRCQCRHPPTEAPIYYMVIPCNLLKVSFVDLLGIRHGRSTAPTNIPLTTPTSKSATLDNCAAFTSLVCHFTVQPHPSLFISRTRKLAKNI